MGQSIDDQLCKLDQQIELKRKELNASVQPSLQLSQELDDLIVQRMMLQLKKRGRLYDYSRKRS